MIGLKLMIFFPFQNLIDSPPLFHILKIVINHYQVYAHIRRHKLESKALKCVLLGYPTGVKGYMLWCYEIGKITISRDVVFKEVMHFLKNTDNNLKQRETEIAELEVEFQEQIQQTSDDVDLSYKGIDTVEDEEEIGQESYWLTRDRTRRSIHAPLRYGQADLVSYAFSVAEELEYQEPNFFKEAIAGREKEDWIRAMKDELDLLEKNATWILVDLPKSQKAIGSKWIFKRKMEITEDNAADMLTKALPTAKFRYGSELVNLMSLKRDN